MAVAALAPALSLTLRAFSCSVILTYCWVRVDAPWVLPPPRLETRARPTPCGSMPLCS